MTIKIENEKQYNQENMQFCELILKNIENSFFLKDNIAIKILHLLKENPDYRDVKLNFLEELCGFSPSAQEQETFNDFLESDEQELQLTYNVSYIKN